MSKVNLQACLCEKCGISYVIFFLDHEDVLTVMMKVTDFHKIHSKCNDSSKIVCYDDNSIPDRLLEKILATTIQLEA